jgi:hypothetical protein
MNHRFYINVAGVCLVALSVMASCQKQYQSLPIGQQETVNDVFNSQDSAGTNALSFLETCYLESLPSGHLRVGKDYLDAASDDAVSSKNAVSDVQELATGQYSSVALNGNDDWAAAYQAIRDNTIFINNIYRVPLTLLLPNGQREIGALRSEARFLRAWNYFELVKRYGGVPLLYDSVFTVTSNVNVPRSSFENCINYVVNECDSIQDTLRTEAMEGGSGYGHITQGAAMALKAQALLFAASPLYNGGNIDPNNPLTGYTNYDITRWQTAATAAQAIMNLGTYGLMTGPSAYPNIFLTQASPAGANTESIMWCMVGNNSTTVEDQNSPVGYASIGALGETSPTAGFVNAFPMANGLPITDPNSGYDPTNPYANRDPRLTATVFYNGSQWLDRAVQTYDGGLDKPGGTIQQTKTSYYMSKFMGLFQTSASNPPDYSGTVEDYIYYRYADVLLEYAEATNEFSGPSQAIYNILESIRARAGISPNTDGLYGLTAGMDQTQMRAAIQLERRLELSFEEKRYYDIRRWKIADQAYNSGPLQGLDIEQNSATGLLTYNPINVLTTSFTDPRMYFYPIPYSEVVKNPNMVQNPGW